ncbi:DUF4153 domain-containing protein [Algicella marina]|uniref:DUF4153 domain-containing protein n=1 Tax=Algicella marina TaxID=2683284 RepID=A0A6P1T0L3_9RHOB|nr:DUF4153 domain-containing protein [Algicella marina]QHQ35537.1 DUF4153 domain-containing protein [Algicella marina]
MTAERLRLVLGATGAVAGFAYYILLEEQALAMAPASLHRFVVYFAIAFFPAFGLLAGPLLPAVAALRAAIIATALSLLVVLAGLRFTVDRPSDILEPASSGLMIGPFLLLVTLLIPLSVTRQWFDYATFFRSAWSAALKTIIALLFLLLFWAVYFLSNALLELVGIDILDDLASEEVFSITLSGAVLGVVLAIAFELDELITTILRLVFGLLRLLLLPVTAVATLFVIAALVQGLDVVFSQRSAAGTMLAMTAGAMLLVIATLGTKDEDFARHLILLWSLRILGAALPIMVSIAIYALWLRIGEYGWTPDRLAGILAAAVALIFTLPVAAYALPSRSDWQRHVRNGLLWSVLATVGIAILWFTPLLDAQRISARSQLARLTGGLTDPATYSYYPLAHEWGKAGKNALDSFKAMKPGPEVQSLIAAAERADNKWAAEQVATRAGNASSWRQLFARIETRPAAATLPPIEDVASDSLAHSPPNGHNASCLQENEPRCIAVAGDFLPRVSGIEWAIVSQQYPGTYPQVTLLYSDAGVWHFSSFGVDFSAEDDADLISILRDRPLEWIDPGVRGLAIGNTTLMPMNPRN